MLGEERFRKSARLAAADQEVAGLEDGVPVGSGSLGGEEPGAGWRKDGEQIIEGIPETQLDVFPIIEADAPDLSVVEGESERLDEMEGGAGGEAEPAGGTCIVGNLGMDQDEVEHRCRKGGSEA